MRLRLKTLSVGKEHGGNIGTPFHLSRGLTLDFDCNDQRNAVLRGGPHLQKVYPLTEQPASNWFKHLSALCDLTRRIEQEIGVRFVATTGERLLGQSDSLQVSRLKTVFAVNEVWVPADYLAEYLLAEYQGLESRATSLMTRETRHESLRNAEELVAGIKDGIRDGRLDAKQLAEIILKSKDSDIPLERAFFLSNAMTLADGVRDILLRACYHYANMTDYLCQINTNDRSAFSGLGAIPKASEINHFSELGDMVAHEFASSVISCYSALDLLYDWFIYLAREPFGEPSFPRKLHFPDRDRSKVFAGGAASRPDDLSSESAPYAIPNLPGGTFKALRRLRNDLTHNMAPDDLRTSIRIGIGLPPVNNELLQYSQYITRDSEQHDHTSAHAWVRNFYTTQQDAQHVLYDWLCETWQCVFDTTAWLKNRLLNK